MLKFVFLNRSTNLYESIIRANKLQVNVARFCLQKLLFCVEIIYRNFNYPKFKHEETLEMLKFVFLNRSTNLYEKIFSSYLQKNVYKIKIEARGNTRNAKDWLFERKVKSPREHN